MLFRSLGSTAAVAALLATLLGIMRMPEYVRIEGVVEPAAVAVIHSETDGFVSQVLASGQPALTDGAPLLVMVNQRLEAQRRQLVAQRAELEARYRQAKVKQPVEAQVALEQLMATDKQIARLVEQFESMVIRAPINGTWVSPESDRLQHIYLKPGQRIGMVASLDMMTIRATAGQSTAARLIGEAGSRVDIRIKGRPDLQLSGSLMRIMPAGQQQLPSAALGYAAGGAMATAADDPQGLKTSERFFEVLVVPDKPEPGDDCSVRLLSGQRVVVRLHLPSRPYGSQLWHRLLQLVQKRFHI